MTLHPAPTFRWIVTVMAVIRIPSVLDGDVGAVATAGVAFGMWWERFNQWGAPVSPSGSSSMEGVQQ